MKITIHGPASGPGASGMIESWGPDEPAEVDDTDKAGVARFRHFVETGLATLVEDVAARGPGRPPKTPAVRPADGP